ncbi:MAG: HAMP domain-containing protein [Syntrophaceae bacterium]|nr:HAMP domain-containing protein [Syntrophaceae bacterium]
MDTKESRRRKRERIIIIITIALIIIMTYVESHLSRVELLLPISSEILIFGLININFILIILLIFLIVRNLVKLIFERKRGIMGSKLRTKLVAAFVGLSLIPTVVLFVVSIQFLSNSIENWFNIKMGSALNVSLEVAQDYYQQLSDNTRKNAERVSGQITDNKLYEKKQAEFLKTLLSERQKDLNLGSVTVYLDNRKENIFLEDPNNPDIPPLELSPKVREDIFSGKALSTVQVAGTGELVSGIVPLYSNFTPREVIGAVVVGYYINKSIMDKMSIISRGSEEYKQLRLLKDPIKISYIIMLSIVTLFIVFSATWFGLFLARGITVPIQDLAEATHRVSLGDLDHHIDVLSDDEIGVLVDSFNKMTRDLKERSEDLERANTDLEQRRQYMATVLRNVSAGVVSIDKDDVITTINSAAERLLSIKTENVLNKKYEKVLKPEHMELVGQFLRGLEESGDDFSEKQVQLALKDRVLTMLVSLAILRDDNNNYMGMVVVFEDLTELQKAERVAAWREVARRIAHEIKNPLTPVRLCAERLQRKYGDKISGDDSSVFQECTGTIISQVDVMKNLVDEFSQFARMPVAKLVPNDLNAVIEDSVALFQDAHKSISYNFIKGGGIPLLKIDAEQIKRVMVNLLDNASAAASATDRKGKIHIITAYDRTHKKTVVEVKDNGPGIAPEDKMRLFEPYFSTKKSGTGLGLAIVNSIISDHNGSVTVKDNAPKGTIVSFELPVT